MPWASVLCARASTRAQRRLQPLLHLILDIRLANHSHPALVNMVSADNINLDCLELIFAYLSGNDLVSVSLVSRSFLAAVIPRLYRTLSFGLHQAKRYPSVHMF